MDALDFGCGTGLVTLQLQPFLHSITGVDGSQGMIDILKQKIEKKNLTNVKTVTNVPTTGGSIQAWAWYKVNYNMQGTGGNDLTVNIATFRSEQQWPSPGYYIYTIGNDVVRTNWHDQAGSTTWNSGFGRMTSLKTNTAYQPGIQYYNQTANLTTAATASITLYSGYQFVYMGTH